MYRIFINEKSLFLSDQPRKGKSVLFSNPSQFDEAIHWLQASQSEEYTLYSRNLEKIWKAYRNAYKVIVAGGGWVKNSENKVLFIHRMGRWDLPKGKLEKGEAIEACAVREVEEECGISGLEINQKIDVTYHMYHQKESIIKETHWFEMRYTGNEKLVPQQEEGIDDVKWVNQNEVEELLMGSFANLRQLVRSNSLV